jgi:hypothetical protein
MDHDPLDDRLASLEARAPAPGAPPSLTQPLGGRRRLGSPVVVAGLLTLGIGATAVAGGAIMGELARGHEGVQNPGQPLAGARMECLSPPEAETFLVRKGFRNVVWQVESGSGKDGRSVQQATAPEHGFVVPGAIVDGRLIMVVDQRDGATGTGACFHMKMP